MKKPVWLTPVLCGATVGAIALATVGFGWGGWVTGLSADKLAAAQARQEVVDALTPICLVQAQEDPEYAPKIAELKAASRYERSSVFTSTGWATMPGATEADRRVADACLAKLAAGF